MADTDSVEEWNYKARQEEEMVFFTELALHETERWIQVVFHYIILSIYSMYSRAHPAYWQLSNIQSG